MEGFLWSFFGTMGLLLVAQAVRATWQGCEPYSMGRILRDLLLLSMPCIIVISWLLGWTGVLIAAGIFTAMVALGTGAFFLLRKLFGTHADCVFMSGVAAFLAVLFAINSALCFSAGSTISGFSNAASSLAMLIALAWYLRRRAREDPFSGEVLSLVVFLAYFATESVESFDRDRSLAGIIAALIFVVLGSWRILEIRHDLKSAMAQGPTTTAT